MLLLARFRLSSLRRAAIDSDFPKVLRVDLSTSSGQPSGSRYLCDPATIFISSSDLPSTSVRPLRYRVPRETLNRH
jgi:hypothetical protein